MSIEITSSGAFILAKGLGRDEDKEVSFNTDDVSITLDTDNELVAISDGRSSYAIDWNDVTVPGGLTSGEDLRDFLNGLVPTAGGGTPITWGLSIPINLSDISSQIVPANPARRGIIITNGGGGIAEDCWIAFGTDPIAERNIKLKKDTSLPSFSVNTSTQEIKGICKANKTTEVNYQEGT